MRSIPSQVRALMATMACLALASFTVMELLVDAGEQETVAPALPAAAPAPADPDPPAVDGVVVILVDALRADALSFIDPSRGVSAPALESLAEGSLVFTRAWAHSHYTKASVGTILTGVYPGEHGGLSHRSRLRKDVPLVTERLSGAGVDTRAVFSNHFMNNAKFGFWRGWNGRSHVDSYRACMGGEPVVARVRELVHRWRPDGPFFAYIHLMDPHSPYNPPASLQVGHLGHRITQGRILPHQTSSFIRRFKRGEEDPPDRHELMVLRELYRGDVEHADAMVADVLDALEESGILSRALLILTSDHGEEFMEHGGLGHGTSLREELVHVPLLLRWPGGTPASVVDVPVGHIDLAPTILDALGLEVPGGMRGRSLLDLVSGTPRGWRDRAFLLEHRNLRDRAIVVGGWKLITGKSRTVLSLTRGGVERDLDLADHPIVWEYLRRRLASLVAGPARPVQEVELDEEEIEKLRAIGYIVD